LALADDPRARYNERETREGVEEEEEAARFVGVWMCVGRDNRGAEREREKKNREIERVESW
jgi:hypothetical protein